MHAPVDSEFSACMWVKERVVMPVGPSWELSGTDSSGTDFTTQWINVMFSDEVRCLKKVDGRIRIWGRIGERFSKNCVHLVTSYYWRNPINLLWRQSCIASQDPTKYNFIGVYFGMEMKWWCFRPLLCTLFRLNWAKQTPGIMRRN